MTIRWISLSDSTFFSLITSSLFLLCICFIDLCGFSFFFSIWQQTSISIWKITLLIGDCHSCRSRISNDRITTISAERKRERCFHVFLSRKKTNRCFVLFSSQVRHWDTPKENSSRVRWKSTQHLNRSNGRIHNDYWLVEFFFFSLDKENHQRIWVILGLGIFSRVILARRIDNDQAQFHALKIMSIKDIIRMNQVQHVNDERAILAAVQHPFIVQL